MKNRCLMIGLAIFLAFTSCKKEETIVPTEFPTMRYTLPQGNASYDATFVDLFNKTQTYFLYKYDPVDFYYQPVTSNTQASNLIQNAFTAPPADPAYITLVFGFVQNNWLNFYSMDFLKKCLPFKVLMSQKITDNTYPTLPFVSNIRMNIESMTIGNFSSAFDALTAAQKKTFKDDLNKNFLYYAIDNNRLSTPADFFTISDYSKSVSSLALYAPEGFVNSNSPNNEGRKLSDLKYFLAAITSLTKAEFDTKFSTTVNTKVAIKYQIVVNYYKTTYGIDLDAVGNTALIN